MPSSPPLILLLFGDQYIQGTMASRLLICSVGILFLSTGMFAYVVL
jgi:O-antigen/teichoic acid export membrane protein